jgi:hypothetical protein
MLSSLGWVMRKLTLIERREVCLWHEANMQTVLEDRKGFEVEGGITSLICELRR